MVETKKPLNFFRNNKVCKSNEVDTRQNTTVDSNFTLIRGYFSRDEKEEREYYGKY